MDFGTVQALEVIHFTGGLRARRVVGGWGIGPLIRDANFKEMGPVPDDAVLAVAHAIGVRAFGVDEIIDNDPYLTVRIWEPLVGLKPSPGLPTELWANIAHNAFTAGDEGYSELARYLSVCLRASGIRIRDISDEYTAQLQSALHNGTVVGNRFENIPLSDLHIAVHSVVAELGAARDYLSNLVGRQLGAPEKKDSLARIVDWLFADARRSEREMPISQRLLEGWESSEDPWLKRLTDYRNLFLHRGPLGARGIESALRLASNVTRYGEIRTLELPIPKNSETDDTVDALTEMVRLHWQMCRLAADLAMMSPYPSDPRILTSADIIGVNPASS